MTEQASSIGPYQSKVLLSVPRKYDVDVHLSRVKVGDEEYLDLREYIPSLQQYGRGLLLPDRVAQAMAEGILKETGASDGERE